MIIKSQLTALDKKRLSAIKKSLDCSHTNQGLDLNNLPYLSRYQKGVTLFCQIIFSLYHGFFKKQQFF
jgi:hypothetical protein